MKRVLCDAVVDKNMFGGFIVGVTGQGEHKGVDRSYVINRETEDEAAREGIRRFVEEMGGDQ